MKYQPFNIFIYNKKTHLSSIHIIISYVTNQKQHLIITALDLEKAYYIVWSNRVLKIIQDINSKMFLFLGHFLKKRSIQVRAQNELSNPY